MPRRATEPLQVVVVGSVLFAIALVVTLCWRDTFGEAWIVCACGIAVGLLGAAVLTVQRRAAMRGARGAQVGLQ